MNDQREEPLKTHIRRQMLEKETRQLLEIWKLNDRKEWSDAAFEVIREILAERLGEVPTQSGSGADIVEDEFEDKYHKTDKLWKISLWANTLSWFILVLYVVVFGARLVSDLLETKLTAVYLAQILFWISLATQLLFGFFLFVILQAVSEVIYILVDIHENGVDVLRLSRRKDG